LLVDKAREGKGVVRLKGGDPFVFGRGGEEAEALRAAGIAFEVVPGVTSAVAVPAYAGIPVTHRGLASTFAVITGHEDPEKPESSIDWAKLATAVHTLVFLMGTKTLREIVEKLIVNGRAPDTPVAVIRWGTTPEQRTVVGTLADIAARVEAAGITPPAITVVGEVVRLRETLSWFENRPLFGKRVLITRTRRQASVLAWLLAEEGAIPIELPAIEIEPTADPGAVGAAIDDLTAGRYGWAVFTSANAVELWFEHLRERGLDSRAFASAKVASIGPATAEALAVRGIVADLVPGEYVAEAVVEALRTARGWGPEPQRVLVPRAEGARPELVDGLRAAGAEVDEVTLYRAAVPEATPAEALSLLRDGAIDIVTFTSSSTVRNLAAMLNGHIETLRGPLVACIGPITAKTADELGLRVDVVASEYTVEGLVRALRERCLGQ
jgi:uroporphyrinogen III methyltransferase/synthase